MPLILSRGAGYESRVAVGVVVFCGMLFATVVTLVMIPAMYHLMARHAHAPEYRSQQLAKALQQTAPEES